MITTLILTRRRIKKEMVRDQKLGRLMLFVHICMYECDICFLHVEKKKIIYNCFQIDLCLLNK